MKDFQYLAYVTGLGRIRIFPGGRIRFESGPNGPDPATLKTSFPHPIAPHHF
jgi:hypothetical protein